MKKKIKSVCISVLMAILCGYIAGSFVYKTYRDNLYDGLTSSRLYLIENGEYDNIYDMREDNSRNNYVYYKDDDKYRAIIGITRKYDNVKKIKSLYSDNLKVFEYYVETDKLDYRQDEYDNKLLATDDMGEVREMVDSILDLYKDSDSLRLIQVD